MPHIPESANEFDWHKYFAIQANNRAWDLASQRSRSDEEAVELLDQAHTSARHWNAVGTELNKMRATYLIAEAHALEGSKQLAVKLATLALEYFQPEETDDWEIAFIYAIYAHALSGSLESGEFASAYHRAKLAVESISDPEDKAIVDQTFCQIPRPKENARGV